MNINVIATISMICHLILLVLGYNYPEFRWIVALTYGVEFGFGFGFGLGLKVNTEQMEQQ